MIANETIQNYKIFINRDFKLIQPCAVVASYNCAMYDCKVATVAICYYV